jgi:hypothetical protein
VRGLIRANVGTPVVGAFVVAREFVSALLIVEFVEATLAAERCLGLYNRRTAEFWRIGNFIPGNPGAMTTHGIPSRIQAYTVELFPLAQAQMREAMFGNILLVLYSCYTRQLWTVGATRANDFRGTVGIVKGQCSGLAQTARYRSGKVVEVPKCIGHIGPIGDRQWNGAR